jgi:hypothetical protein
MLPREDAVIDKGPLKGTEMDSDLSPAITKLATGEILRIDDALGNSIVLVQGMVWITQEGDPRDVFLSDGESFVFDRAGIALVQAITNTRLIAFVGESAEVIADAAAPSMSSEVRGVQGGLAGSVLLHRDLAAHAQLAGVPAHQLA